MPELDAPQDVVTRFFKVANDTFKAALLGQYGDSYTPNQLRTELKANAVNLIPMWSATDSPYVLTSPQVDEVNAIIDQAVEKFQAWILNGRPRV